MKVLMLSKDGSILRLGSEAQERMRTLSAIVERLYVIVLTTREKQSADVTGNFHKGIPRIRIGRRLVLYPTDSATKFSSLTDAWKIGRELFSSRNSRTYKSWLITAQDPFETGFVGWLLAKRYKVALEIQIHTDIESPFFKKESLKNTLRGHIARFLLPRATGVRAVSSRIADSVRVSLGCHPETLPVFVDALALRASPPKLDLHKQFPQFDFLILAVSRLSKEKDIGTALRAVGKVAEKYPKTGLLILGDGPERKKLESFAQHFGAWQNTVFLGWQDDIASYYKSADAYILTSLYEGYGRTVIEAASVGCPILMSDVGIAGELFTHNENALVCPPGDAECFAEGLLRIRRDESVRRALSVRAEQTINDLALSREEYLKRQSTLWRALAR